MDFVRQLSEAKSGWRTFHQKDEPTELIEVGVVWPQHWACAGYAVTMYYSSDKWYRDGDFVNYYHDHSKHVKVYHPVGVVRGGDIRDFATAQPPVKQWPSSAFALGDCLGWDMRAEKGSRDIYRALPDEGTILCSFPSRRVLFALSEAEGVVALFAGPGLEVQDVGIVG